MKTRIHRERFLFRWIAKNYEIIVGLKSVKRGKCIMCSKTIPWENTICDECFEKNKDISKK